MAVAKPELGIKRQCANCGAKFYDLAKTPIVCPKCGTVYEVTAASARRTAAKAPAPEAAEAPVADTETVSLEEVAEQEKRASVAKGAPPDVDAEDDEVEDTDADDDTFLEEEEEEAGDVSDLIGEGIDKKEEET